MQYQAGFIVDNLFEPFSKDNSSYNQAETLCKWLSHFEVESRHGWENEPHKYFPPHAVLINLLQRGIPTRLNIHALKSIVEASPLLDWEKKDFEIKVKWNTENDKTLADTIFRSLHIIEPRVNQNTIFNQYQSSWEKLGSQFEEDFYFSVLPDALGANSDYLIQLFTAQRPLNSILESQIDTSKLAERLRTNFEEQKTDFSCEFPYIGTNERSGLVIEVDGFQHQQSEQLYLDTERDKAVAAAKWNNTVRIKTEEFNSLHFKSLVQKRISPYLNNNFIQVTAQNYREPIWNTDFGKQVLELTLMPFAIARFQSTLIEALAKGKLLLSASKWKIAVLERDVPFAQIAVDDLQKTLDHLNQLSTEKIELPPIELSVYCTNEFKNSAFHSGTNIKLIQEFDTQEAYDMLFDVSVLERDLLSVPIDTNAKDYVTLRSVHYINCTRQVATSSLIKYQPLCEKNKEDNWGTFKEKEKHLEYFLQSIFRKKEFRQGQVPIIHKALQCKSVIGLLATGGGKSITYQLSALLQPGVCLVIDPIRSLMKDQVDGLMKNGIDSCVYINSTLKGEDKRIAMQKLKEGEAQFAFISPERLQMEEFRSILEDMAENEIFFSYCVIDEAHCVSEWGHDFRTAYLRLGENAMRYCKTENLKSVPLFGLTATASYDVLADVQRELSGNDEKKRLDEDAIIRFESTKRAELQFVIEHIAMPNTAKDIWDLKNILGTKKQERVKQILDGLPLKLQNFKKSHLNIFSKKEWVNGNSDTSDEIKKSPQEQFDYLSNINLNHFFESQNSQLNYRNGGLIFCPHTKGIFGVTDKHKVSKSGQPVIRQGYYDTFSDHPDIKAGYFMGSGNDQDDSSNIIQEESFKNQDSFINNETNLMVATKAFGMGIDKENIRYTIHVNYPSSIESFVQEAGRAGRDRKLAVSYILFNDEEVELTKEEIIYVNDMDINMYFHRNSFKGEIKELAIVDELLTEIYFPDRTFELENLIASKLDIEVKCNYWERETLKRLYINNTTHEDLGFIDLTNIRWFSYNSVDPQLSYEISKVIIPYIQSLNLKEPVYTWIQRSDKEIGIAKLLESKEVGDEFSLTVGFYNNVTERVKTLAGWIKKVIHNNFDEQTVKSLRVNCHNANDFIEKIAEQYLKFCGKELDFEATCHKSDKEKNLAPGTTLKRFSAYYNGYRDKMDTEKAIYRLSTLGVIDDYTVNFSANTFTLYGRKQSNEKYKANLRKFLLKYYSEKTADIKLKELENFNEATEIQNCLHFLVFFIYKEIQAKRALAMKDMKMACKFWLDKERSNPGSGNVEFKEYIDLYFNSKYARREYSFEVDGKEINASLPLITNDGKSDELDFVWKFIEIIGIDPKGSEIDNIKHLRGACTRMLNSQRENFTFLLLNAFSLYMLEYKNPRFLQEAESLLQNGFSSLMEKNKIRSDDKIEKEFNHFTSILSAKNPELEKYMNKFGFSFDIDDIMIKRLLAPLQNATNTLKMLNETLN